MSLHLSRYHKLINFYRENLPEGFVEKHHIIPKCMGGDDSLSNLVLLPARAHFIAHYLLHKAYPDNRSLAHAFAMMGVCNGRQHRFSKLYEKSKIARSNALSGVPRPEWVKQKLRKPKSNTQNYKKPKSKEHASKISSALKGKKKEVIKCAHCSKIGSASTMSRWHFDNCKSFKQSFIVHPATPSEELKAA